MSDTVDATETETTANVPGAVSSGAPEGTAATTGTADTAHVPAPAGAGSVAAAGTAAPDAADVGVERAIRTTDSPDASDTGSAPNAPEAVSAADQEGAGDTAASAGTAHAPDAVGADRAGDSDASTATSVVSADADAGTATSAGAPADASADTDAASTTPTRRLFRSTLGVALVLLLVDQISKWWAVGALGDSESIEVIGDVLRFWLIYNPGAAFSMGTGVTWIFTIFAGVAVVAISWYAWRVRSTPWAYALGLLLGGATSHFGDRLFREPGFGRGHVVDFIDYGGHFVGNVADIGIFAGAVTIVVLAFKGIEAVEPARPTETAEATDAVGDPAE